MSRNPEYSVVSWVFADRRHPSRTALNRLRLAGLQLGKQNHPTQHEMFCSDVERVFVEQGRYQTATGVASTASTNQQIEGISMRMGLPQLPSVRTTIPSFVLPHPRPACLSSSLSSYDQPCLYLVNAPLIHVCAAIACCPFLSCSLCSHGSRISTEKACSRPSTCLPSMTWTCA